MSLFAAEGTGSGTAGLIYLVGTFSLLLGFVGYAQNEADLCTAQDMKFEIPTAGP